MKLLGSRASGTHDEYSDWDYRVESADDFVILQPILDIALCWRYQNLGPLTVLTLITPDFVLYDYTDDSNMHEAEWKKIAAQEDNVRLAEFWILAFKHLKGIHRSYLLLLDCGIDLSVQLLRDVFVETHFGTLHYKDFFAYKYLSNEFSEKCAPIFDVTGLPASTIEQRIEKIRAINALYASLTPANSKILCAGAEEKLLSLRNRPGR
jgi:hypothetical protein